MCLPCEQRRIVDQTKRFEEEEEEGEDGDAEAGSSRGCRCSRTKCLKQYCQCFRKDVRCSAECVCDDCHNDGKHEEKRIDAIRRIRMNNASAFQGTALEIEDQQVITPRGTTKMIRGCRCKRSKCKKKYCECFGADLACTTNCVCIDCENGNTWNVNSVSAIMKHDKTDDQLRGGVGHDLPESKQRAAGAAGSNRPKAKAGGASSSVSVLPSQNKKPPQARSAPQPQTAQRPPSGQDQKKAAPGSGSAGGGVAGTGGKKSFRRNDLKVGVPVPTYVLPSDGNGMSSKGQAGQAIVTPHGSILLPSGRSNPSPRSFLATPGAVTTPWMSGEQSALQPH